MSADIDIEGADGGGEAPESKRRSGDVEDGYGAVVTNRSGGSPDAYHTNWGCGALAGTDPENIRKKRLHLLSHLEECSDCAGTSKRVTDRGQDCTFCGAEDILLWRHLPCEESIAADTKAPEPDTSRRTPSPTPAPPRSDPGSDEIVPAAEAAGADGPENPFPCPTCHRQGFDGEGGLQIHHVAVHGYRLDLRSNAEREREIPCPTCKQPCDGERGLQSHHHRVHGHILDLRSDAERERETEDLIPCPTCDREDLSGTNGLQSHHRQAHGHTLDLRSNAERRAEQAEAAESDADPDADPDPELEAEPEATVESESGQPEGRA